MASPKRIRHARACSGRIWALVPPGRWRVSCSGWHCDQRDETMNTSKRQNIIRGVLVLLSFMSLALLQLSAKPPGINDVAFSDLFNSGRISEIQPFIHSAERHTQFLVYEQAGLLAVLGLIGLLFEFLFAGQV